VNNQSSKFKNQSSLKQPKVAIVHDWLYGGGAEKVVLALHEMYPNAPIYTSYCTKEWQEKLNNKVVTGYLNKWPFNKIRKFIPFLRIWWFERLDLNSYDIVISSSGAEAKGVKKLKPTAVHINYCHAPTHYYWSRYNEYIKQPGFGIFDPLARFGLKILVGPLRKWDFKAAQKPNYIIANSTNIQNQIKQYYKRDSLVIHPPVNIDKFIPQASNKKNKNGLVITGRQVPYKRIDLAIKAAIKTKQQLSVIGNGPLHNKLVKLAADSQYISFYKNVSDQDLINMLQKSELFIFPGVEDFGIAPVEALAAGTPVIAYKKGGALDYINKYNGVFFDRQNSQELANAIMFGLEKKWNVKEISESSLKFSVNNFKQKFADFLKTV
jgi:glycosyltransferase involved in cell wall biosynthesis